MSRETKIGLLVATGIILTFAFILQMQLAGEPMATLDHDNESVHLSQTPVTPDHPTVSGGESGTDRPAPDSGQERLADVPETGHDEPLVGDAADESAEDTGKIVVHKGPVEGDETLVADGANGVPDQGQVDDDEAVEQVAVRSYTVVSGDSLYRIAEKEFGPGKGTLWRRIAEANPELRDPKRLKAGMKITIPALEPLRVADRQLQSEQAQDVPDTQPPTGPRIYVVQAGDTLGEISQKELGTSKKWQLISQANGNLDPSSLRVGQKLTIPVVAEERHEVAVVQSDGPTIERALDEVSQFVSDSRQPTGIYRVRPGDSLYAIARRVLSNGDRWKEIYELNRDKMSSPNDLASGQVILVPSLGQVAMVDQVIH